MKTNMTLFFLLVFSSNMSIAQCDLALYEKMRGAPHPFVVLKRYSIKVSEIKDVPFSVNYSYVFTKGSTYAIILKESDARQRLSFTLTDSDGDVLNSEMFSVNTDGKKLTAFTASKTGIYYMNIYSPTSFDGCAVLQLSYANESTHDLSHEEWAFKRGIENKYNNPLKVLVINGGKRMQITHVFTAGITYNLYVENQNGMSNPVTLGLTNVADEALPFKKTKNDLGHAYEFRPIETGTYYLDFINPDPEGIAVAVLSVSNDHQE